MIGINIIHYSIKPMPHTTMSLFPPAPEHSGVSLRIAEFDIAIFRPTADELREWLTTLRDQADATIAALPPAAVAPAALEPPELVPAAALL